VSPRGALPFIPLQETSLSAPDRIFAGHILGFQVDWRTKAGGEIWSIPTKGGTPEKSPIHVRPDEQPVVSPDGTQIAFVGRKSSQELWVMTGLLPATKPTPVR
jgi:hypothetical protein